MDNGKDNDVFLKIEVGICWEMILSSDTGMNGYWILF